MGDILKFPAQKTEENKPNASGAEGQVLDVTQRIQDRQADDRRRAKRVVLNEFISAHVYVAGRGLLKIALKDINEEGLAFEVDQRQGEFTRGESLEVRFYLNHETYFKFHVQVAHATHLENEAVYRHGCKFTGDSLNNVALHHFTSFLQNIAASLRTDKGDRIITNLYS